MPVIVAINNVSLVVTVTGGPANPRDFVGIYLKDSQLNQYLVWKYLANNETSPRPNAGIASGTVTLALSSIGNSYVIRFVSINAQGVMKLEFESGLLYFGPWSKIAFSPPEGAEITGLNSWRILTPEGVRLDISPSV